MRRPDKVDRLMERAREKVAALAQLMGLPEGALQVRKSLVRLWTHKGDRTAFGVGVYGDDQQAVNATVEALYVWAHREQLVVASCGWHHADPSAQRGGPACVPTLDEPEPAGAYRGMVEVFHRR